MTRAPGPTPSAHAAEIHAAIQQLLLAHGCYSPVELLLTTNRLDYDDYQAWRRGSQRTLDPVLRDGVATARSFLEEADLWARGLDLKAQPFALFGIEAQAGLEIRASSERGLDELLHTEYRRDVDLAQPDLFLDGAEADIQNRLTDAVLARDANRAGELLRDLVALDPEHWAVTDAMALIDALHAAPPDHADQARRHLDVLEHRWRPSALALLGADARDFLSPLWRAAGRALEGAPFEPDDPNGHASWAYLNGLDWAKVKRSVLAEPDWETEPALLVRLAHARWRLRDRRDAMRLWFALCWLAPAQFAENIESVTFPDSALQRDWAKAQDQDLDPPITPPWFPVWMVIEHRGIARTAAPCGGTSDPERAFDHLVALRRGGSDREDLDHRRALKDLHPDLLGYYLQTIDE